MRLRPESVVLLVALLLTGGAWAALDQFAKRQARAALLAEATALQQRIEARLALSLGPVEGIAMLINASDVTPAAVLERAGPRLQQRDPLFVSLALAPGLVIRDVYPREPNRAAIGLDFRAPPVDLAALRAFESGEAVLAGPFTLRQGGTALAIRVPYRRPGPEGAADAGLVSIAIDFGALLVDSGFEAFAQRHRSSLIAVDADGRPRSVLWGQTGALGEATIEKAIAVPGGRWRWVIDVAPITPPPAGNAALWLGLPVSLLLALLARALRGRLQRAGRAAAEPRLST